MPSLAGFYRPSKHLPDPTPERTLAWMVRLTQDGLRDVEMRLFAEKLVLGLKPHDYLSEYAAVVNWVRTHIRYSRDPVHVEQVKTPRVVLETETGDCFTLETEIIVRDRGGFYQQKRLEDLRYTFSMYDALSYNFDEGRFEFKPILAWTDKGHQPTLEVRLTNGCSFFCTEDHKLYAWHQRDKAIITAPFRQLKSTVKPGLKSSLSLLYAKEIPALDQVVVSSPEAAWLFGAYIAEGWDDGYHVCIAKVRPAQEEITSRLDRLGVPYSCSKREKSAYVTVLKSDFKELLRAHGPRALFKHFVEEELSSSREILRELLTGYTWGDGWKPKATRRSHLSHVTMLSTVSNQLAAQLKVLYLILGRPLSMNLVHRHGGLGRNPIWRLWEASGKLRSSIGPDQRPMGLTSKSIRWAESVGNRHVCDITVADNHNFVLSNGIIAHNCDDMSVLVATFVSALGGKSRFVAGAFERFPSGKPNFVHVWAEAYDPNSRAWIVLDPVPGRNVSKMIRRLIDSIVVSAVD